MIDCNQLHVSTKKYNHEILEITGNTYLCRIARAEKFVYRFLLGSGQAIRNSVRKAKGTFI